MNTMGAQASGPAPRNNNNGRTPKSESNAANAANVVNGDNGHSPSPNENVTERSPENGILDNDNGNAESSESSPQGVPLQQEDLTENVAETPIAGDMTIDNADNGNVVQANGQTEHQELQENGHHVISNENAQIPGNWGMLLSENEIPDENFDVQENGEIISNNETSDDQNNGNGENISENGENVLANERSQQSQLPLNGVNLIRSENASILSDRDIENSEDNFYHRENISPNNPERQVLRTFGSSYSENHPSVRPDNNVDEVENADENVDENADENQENSPASPPPPLSPDNNENLGSVTLYQDPLFIDVEPGEIVDVVGIVDDSDPQRSDSPNEEETDRILEAAGLTRYQAGLPPARKKTRRYNEVDHGEGTSSSYRNNYGEGTSSSYRNDHGEGTSSSYRSEYGEGTSSSYRNDHGEGTSSSYRNDHGEGTSSSYHNDHGEGTSSSYHGQGTSSSYHGEGSSRSWRPDSSHIDADYELALRLQNELNADMEEEERQRVAASVSNVARRPCRWDDVDNSTGILEYPEDSRQDSFVKEMWKCYRQCQRKNIEVPQPFSISINRNPLDYLNGYRRLLGGLSAPVFFRLAKPRSASLVSRPILPFYNDDDRQPGPSNRPSAFQKFVQSANAMINRPEFSRDHEDDEDNQPVMPHRRNAMAWAAAYRSANNNGGSSSSSNNNEEDTEIVGPRRPLSDRTPAAFLRQLTDEPEDDAGADAADEHDSEDDDDDAPGADDAVFAVPAVPFRGGLYTESQYPGQLEVSPAARRIRNLDNRSTQGLRGRSFSYSSRNDHGRHVSRLAEQHHSRIRPSGPVGASTSGPPRASSSAYRYRSRSRSRSPHRDSDSFDDIRMNHPYLRHPGHRQAALQGFEEVTMEEDEDVEVEDDEENQEEQVETATWPLIRWCDPENMPPIEEIDEDELAKMPQEYINEIVAHHSRPPSPEPVMHPFMIRYLNSPGVVLADKENADIKMTNETKYFHLVRINIPSPNAIPPEVMNTRFEVFIRFPFLQRPLYVQNVLSALNVPDNGGDVVARLPRRFRNLSTAEFLKRAVNIWRGRMLDNLPVDRALSDEEMEAAEQRYYCDLTERHRTAASMVEDDLTREAAYAYVDSNVHCVVRDDVNDQDLIEMQVFEQAQAMRNFQAAREQQRHEQEEEARRQIAAIGNALSARRRVATPPIREVAVHADGSSNEYADEVAFYEVEEEDDEVHDDQEEEFEEEEPEEYVQHPDIGMDEDENLLVDSDDDENDVHI